MLPVRTALRRALHSPLLQKDINRLSRFVSTIVRPEEAQEFRVPVPHGHIAGKQWGNMKGYPILCLHGLSGNCESFTPVAPYLTDQFHYIAPDAFGHGKSYRAPPGVVMTFWEFVLNIQRLAKHLKLEKFSMMGHSVGGSSALAYASIYPEMVDCLVLLDVEKILSLPAWWLPQSTRDAFDAHFKFEDKLGEEQKLKSCSMDALVEKFVDSLGGILKPEAARILMKRGSKPVGDGFAYSHDPRMMVPVIPRLTLEEQRTIIQGLKCHLKIVKAKPGIFFESEEVIEEFKGYFKKQCASYEFDDSIEGTHEFHLHNPELLAPIVNEFFSKHLLAKRDLQVEERFAAQQ